MKVICEGEREFVFADDTEVSQNQPFHGWFKIKEKDSETEWWFNSSFVICIGPGGKDEPSSR